MLRAGATTQFLEGFLTDALFSLHVTLQDIHDSCEPAMFSLEQLLFAVASDTRTNGQTLAMVLPMMREVFEREKAERDLIKVRRFLFDGICLGSLEQLWLTLSFYPTTTKHRLPE